MRNKANSASPPLTLVQGGTEPRQVRLGLESGAPVLQVVGPTGSLAPEREARVRDLSRAIEEGEYRVPPEWLADRMLAEWEALRDWQARLLAQIVQQA